jgi:hypothetical protein
VNATVAAEAAGIARATLYRIERGEPGGLSEVTAEEALNIYERNWRHVDIVSMDARERDLVKRLADTVGGGRLLV